MHTTLDLLAADGGLTLNVNPITGTILSALAQILVLWAAAKVFMAYASRNWGLIVTEIVAVVVVGFFIWTPTQAIEVVKNVSSTVFGIVG